MHFTNRAPTIYLSGGLIIMAMACLMELFLMGTLQNGSTIAIFDRPTIGPQIIIGSSLGGWPMIE